VPQPPNQWGGPQSPQGGQPVGGPPQWGPPPAKGSRLGSVALWGPQQPYGGPTGQGPGRGGKGKWIFVAFAVMAVIAVTVVITGWWSARTRAVAQLPTSKNGNGSDFARRE